MIEENKTNISTSFTFNTCNSLTAKSMTLNFWEELLHLPNYNWSTFEANPTVDLRETINQPKVQRLHHGNPFTKPSSTPSTSNTCNSLTAKPMTLNFWEELLHLPNYNWSNFEANPTVDLRETINQPKFQRFHYHYLLHTTPFSYFHNLSLNTSHTQKTNNLSLVSLHDPLSLFPLSNESFEILAPINDFLILQGPMRFWEWIAIQLKLGWESLGPMKHKRDSIL